MGAVNFSIDTELVKTLKKYLLLNIFVETGTFKGDTIEKVKDLFIEIHSVELSKEYFTESKKRFELAKNINLYLDSSEKFLNKLHQKLKEESVLYWLDAHWCVADKTAGEKSQCPLLDELEAIKTLNSKSIVIIDDARLFIAPPPSPHEISHWPDINSIIIKLNKISNKHLIMFLNDTIIFYPNSLNDVINKYGYENSVDWLALLHKTRDYDNLRKQFDGLQTQFEGLLSQLKEKDQKIILDNNDLKEKDQKIILDNNDLKEKGKKIFSLSDDLKEKENKIFSLSDELMEKERRIITIDDELVLKEKEILFLSNSLSILKKRLATPVWGMLTLFQHHFPSVWEFLFNKVELLKKRRPIKATKNKLPFLEPRLGRLYHYEPREIIIPKRYYKTRYISNFPRVSIITPSFNHGIFIKKTIDSIICQNYGNLEYFIQDSCSNDDTGIILKGLSNPFIKHFTEKDNGQADAINRGFNKCTGEIMAWINSDDCYLPGTFNYVVNYFVKNPDVDVVYGHRVLIDADDKEIGRWVLPRHDKKVLCYADFIPQETLFWRRKIWKKTGNSLNEEYHFALDWELLLRFQDAGAKIVRLPRFLAAFRIHPQQKTSAQISSLGEEEMNRLRKRYIGRDVPHSEINKEILTYLAKSEILNKLYRLKLVKY